jgi:dihydrolipoamide dehydrogenase
VDFEHAIIATGSRPVSPPGLGVRPEGRIMDSTGALALGDVPERLLVVGGGYVGLEMGTVYAVLGSRVTLVEMADRLLPGADTDLVRPLRRRLDELFDAIRLETRVTRAQEDDRGVAVTLEGGNGEEGFDRVLVAVGRRPNTDDIGLTEAGVALDDQGLISVDEQRRTSQERIFAIGDAVGGVQLAHKAMHEGKVAAEAIAGRPAAFDPRAIPAVVYTDPQVAWCGLTEDDARSQGREVTVTRFPWRASGRALTTGSEDGLTKLIMDPETGRLLGAGMVGPNAGELIAETVLALEMGADAEDIGLTIHPHPTLSETVMESADVFFGQSAHFYRPKRY